MEEELKHWLALGERRGLEIHARYAAPQAMISPAPPAARACRYLIVRSLHCPLMSKLLWCALTATRLATSTGPILIGLKRCG